MSPLKPKGKPGQPVICLDCGYEFSQDPPYYVDCPLCGAKAGHYCKRPSGHSGPFVDFHAERDLVADKAGFYKHNCMAIQLGFDYAFPSTVK